MTGGEMAAMMKGQVMMTLGIIVVLIGVVFYMFMFNFVTMNRPVWTMAQLADDYVVQTIPEVIGNRTIQVPVVYYFKSVNSGSVIYVRDVVKEVEYNGRVGKSVVWFESTGKGRIGNWSELRNESALSLELPDMIPFLYFDGDVSTKLKAGADVGIRIEVVGSTEKQEYIKQEGEPGEGADLGLSADDIIDVGLYQTIGLAMLGAGAALAGLGAYLTFVRKEAAKEPVAAGAAPAKPTRVVAAGPAVRHTKCPTCGASIAIAPGATTIQCQSCGRSYQIGGAGTAQRAAAAGGRPQPQARQTKCPGCGAMIAIPPGATTIRCQSCGRMYSVGGAAAQPQATRPQMGARQAKCPSCGATIAIPPGATTVSCQSCGSAFRIG
ncbi:MAG TPA: hypothetical protein EYP43_03805 [Thermoplasmata archaeon]|nr:hypothetical protein [Thermoplasmata archaeon]